MQTMPYRFYQNKGLSGEGMGFTLPCKQGCLYKIKEGGPVLMLRANCRIFFHYHNQVLVKGKVQNKILAWICSNYTAGFFCNQRLCA